MSADRDICREQYAVFVASAEHELYSGDPGEDQGEDSHVRLVPDRSRRNTATSGNQMDVYSQHCLLKTNDWSLDIMEISIMVLRTIRRMVIEEELESKYNSFVEIPSDIHVIAVECKSLLEPMNEDNCTGYLALGPVLTRKMHMLSSTTFGRVDTATKSQKTSAAFMDSIVAGLITWLQRNL
ncbi:hypothetical protein PsorP6_011207 [Peronosclerospora sorghi]|uniref:Uncharacterized protein n=1 Tax=Peronosclerospora sorghi TaxID=230839 RepID=A0ACC0VU02_9STRA|nr:hypothetical protein PsorP6_011207 [Peronosclerospora sorghi]